MASKKLTPQEKAKNVRQKARRERQVLSGAVVERAKKIFGSVVNLYNIPEIKELIDEGYINEWTPEEFLRRLDNTNWAKERTLAQEKYDILKSSNPEEASSLVETNAGIVRRILASKNLSLPDEEIMKIAETGTRSGWSQLDFDDNVSVEAMRVGGTQAAPQKTELKSIAKEYGVNVTDKDLDTWLSEIVTNRKSTEQFQEYVRESAKTLYPTIADRLQTTSFSSIVAPYRSIYEQILETPADDIDFTSTAFSSLFNAGDENNKRMMNSTEWVQYLRKRPEWQNTANAYAEYGNVAETLNRIFGGTR